MSLLIHSLITIFYWKASKKPKIPSAISEVAKNAAVEKLKQKYNFKETETASKVHLVDFLLLYFCVFVGKFLMALYLYTQLLLGTDIST